MKKMTLITKEIEKRLPGFKQLEKVKDPICHVKFFNPCGVGTWWVAAKDGDILYGIAELGYKKEMGSFSLSEIEALKCPAELLGQRFTLPVERDLYFKPTSMSEIMADGEY